VSLVLAGEEAAFIGALKQAYYRKLVDAGKLDPDAAWSDIVFASKPASGGAIIRLNV
jgi:hypothetical protein